MQTCVIVPTFQRSDLLAVCLEHIRAADPQISIHVFPDRGTNEIPICERYGAVHHLTLQHSYHGNSFNMLEALRWASKNVWGTTYIVEDDAMIRPDFFSWADEALTFHGLSVFAACGWQYSPDALISDGPDLLIPWYLSVCSALPRRSVTSIIQHARPEYYGDMQAYLDRTYPSSHRRGSQHFEQDGLILRICESESKRCVWPRRPRAVHAGFYGYHMGDGKLKGTLEERIEIIKLAIKNPSLLTRIMSGARLPDISNCETCGKTLLTTNKDAQVVCVDCFHRRHPALPVTSTECYYIKPLEE